MNKRNHKNSSRSHNSLNVLILNFHSFVQVQITIFSLYRTIEYDVLCRYLYTLSTNAFVIINAYHEPDLERRMYSNTNLKTINGYLS